MSKIAEVVQLKTGYANFVELKSAFEEAQENTARMAMYRPTKAHRKAFERLCRGLYTPTDKKFYLLSGSYGTGKSHLCLMLANFLSRASSDPDIRGFYDNYRKLDPTVTQTLSNVRKTGQFLVAICDYHSGQRFEDVVLKSVFEACEKMGLDAGVQTEFDEAERLLAQWEKASGDAKAFRDYYADFAKALEQVAPGVPVDQLRASLRGYDSDAVEQFRAAYKLAQGGAEFQAQSGNLIPIIQKLVRSREFRDRFVGLAVFFDEFGFTLEKAAYSKDVLQGFMETVCKNEPNVVFVGCIHKDFRNYADRLSQADAAVMTARLTQVDLLNEGIEEIIGAIVETDKACDTWRTEVEPKLGVLDQLVPPCKSLNLFPWIDDLSRVRQRVLEDIYGVHPMALACLLRLSSEIGSDARSTFTFFSGDVGGEPGSYAAFIEDAEVTIDGGALRMYRTPALYDFFRSELSPRNPELRDRQRQLVNGYVASVGAVRKAAQGQLLKEEEEYRTDLLRTILVYELCQMATSVENIQFGMYCLSKSQQRQAENELKKLEKLGALYFRKQSKTYELAASDAFDPYDLIERYVEQAEIDTSVDAFVAEAKGKDDLTFLVANQYNLAFNEDKRLLRRFVRAKDLDTVLWDKLSKELTEAAANETNSAEGFGVYVVCEDDAEVHQARQAVSTINHPNIIVGIPTKAQPYSELLCRVKACRHYLSSEEEGKLTAQTVSRLRDMLDNADDGFFTELKRYLQDVASGESACWYGEAGRIIVDQPKQSHRPADMLMEGLFRRRCRIKHPDLNQVHDDRWRKGRNTALRQAVEILLDESVPVQIDNGHPANHGQKRYLQSVLLNGTGALKQTDNQGAVSYFQCESDESVIADDFPVLKQLCRRLSSDPSLPVRQFVQEAAAPGYGAGGTMLTLALAFAVRAFGERLRIYSDSTRTKSINRTEIDYDRIVEMGSSPADGTFFVVTEISPAHRLLVGGTADAVKAPPLAHGASRTVTDAHAALVKWWRSVPDVARVTELYDASISGRLGKLVQTLTPIDATDKFDLIFTLIPQVYADTPVTTGTAQSAVKQICADFASDVALLNTGLQRITERVSNAICALYGGKGDVVECEQLVDQWYKGLSPTQRQADRFEDDASDLIAVLSQGSASFNVKLLRLMPSHFGLGGVSEWTTLKVDDYTGKWRIAKKVIDEAKPVLPPPEFQSGSSVHESRSDVWEIGSGGRLGVKVPKGAKGFIYTLDGSDPKTAEGAVTVEDELSVDEALINKPTATLRVRTVDGEGNFGDLVKVQIVNKAREYEVVAVDDFYLPKGTFRMPETLAAFVTVLRSLVTLGRQRGLLTQAKADKLLEAIERLGSE
jgi:hypothetical protein